MSSCLWLKTPAQAGEITAALRAPLQKKAASRGTLHVWRANKVTDVW